MPIVEVKAPPRASPSAPHLQHTPFAVVLLCCVVSVVVLMRCACVVRVELFVVAPRTPQSSSVAPQAFSSREQNRVQSTRFSPRARALALLMAIPRAFSSEKSRL